MQIPILNGIYTDLSSNVRISYPKNLIPVPKELGLSKGYLRPAYGISALNNSCVGTCRGTINWDGILYAVMGQYLVSYAADGTETVLGDVGNDLVSSPVSLDYSFDRLAIASSKKLFYYDKATLTEVTDPDLGNVLDFIWVDGYFMTTDGEFLVVTELADPTQVLPFKYGSSEFDPDPVLAIKKLINEPYAVNRYSIEPFDNIGGSAFPFQRIDGARVNKGAVGTHACCLFENTIAFVGGGRNESTSIWLAASGSLARIATQEIDQVLKGYTEFELSNTITEEFNNDGHQFLLVHLPDRTLVYDAFATKALEEKVWFTLTSSNNSYGIYKARFFVWCYNKWIAGSPTDSAIGVIKDDISTHWGEDIGWEFSTMLIYNMSNSGIVHDLELLSLTGRAKQGLDPVIWTSYSKDGLVWSQERPLVTGQSGDYNKRLMWFNQGTIGNIRTQKFRGLSDCGLSFLRLEANIEGLLF